MTIHEYDTTFNHPNPEYVPYAKREFMLAGLELPTADTYEKPLNGFDRTYNDPEALVYGVLDGVGNDHGGAAHHARRAIVDVLSAHSSELYSIDEANEQMRAAFTSARLDLDARGIRTATTATFARMVLIGGRPHVSIGHAGDCRLFILTAGGQLIEPVKEQGLNEPGRENVITNAVAADTRKSASLADNYVTLPFEPGSRLAIFSDGIGGDKPKDRLKNGLIRDALARPSVQDTVTELAQSATKADDRSVVVVELPRSLDSQGEETPIRPYGQTRLQAPYLRNVVDAPPTPHPISRRLLLGAGATTLTVGLATLGALKLFSGSGEQEETRNSNPNTQPPAPRTTAPESVATIEAPADLETARLELETIRQELGITDATYWQSNNAPDETLKAIRESATADGFLITDTVLPIYPAAVMKHAEAIENAAKEFGVPANILAIIATMESAGDTSARSDKLAQGMFQIIAKSENGNDVHGERIRRLTEKDNPNATDSEVLDMLNDPVIAARVSADIVREYYGRAVSANPDNNPNSIWTWGHMLAAYNGGPSVAGADFDAGTKLIANESALYAKNGMRFMMDAEVAAQLQNKGFSEQTIRWAMSSILIDSQAYAYNAVKEPYLNPDDIQAGFETVITPLKDGSVGDQFNPHQPGTKLFEITDKLIIASKAYLAAPQYELKLPPALRIWLSAGGIGLFQKTPANTVAENYTNPQ